MAALDGPADWHKFTQDTSLHGLRFIHHTSVSKVRRVLWAIFMLFTFGWFVYAVTEFMEVYANRSLSTKIQVERAKALTFPTVTICNNNLWKYSYMAGTVAWLNGSTAMFDIMSDLYAYGTQLPPPPGKYDWSAHDLAIIAALLPEDTDNFFRDSAHTLEQTFLSCRLFGEIRNCSDLLKQVPTDGGFCYQFNSDGSLIANSAGKSGGVEFVLDAATYEYSMGPSSHSKGFTITLHDSHEVPVTTELGVAVAPGFQINMALQKATTQRYPPPADKGRADCLDTTKKPNPLHYYQNYTYSACQVECKTAYVINRCGCRDPLQPALNGTQLCMLPQMLNCSQLALREFASDDDGLPLCECRDPCYDSEYSTTMSAFTFPSGNYLALQGLQDSAEYIEQNWAIVDIFYGKMSYHRIEEDLAYKFLDMVANLGGTLGLCMGASILTICEMFEYCVLRLHRCRKGGRPTRTSRIKVMPSPEATPTRDLEKIGHFDRNINSIYGQMA